jgi:hypothetical protein
VILTRRHWLFGAAAALLVPDKTIILPPAGGGMRPTPVAGETWFVLLWHGGVVLAVRVDEVTEQTVVLWAQSDCGSRPASRAYRYRIRDVTWLERIEAAPVAGPEVRYGPACRLDNLARFSGAPVVPQELTAANVEALRQELATHLGSRRWPGT